MLHELPYTSPDPTVLRRAPIYTLLCQLFVVSHVSTIPELTFDIQKSM